MYVTDLGGADGMVFVFDRPTEAHFDMWQTPMALTIARSSTATAGSPARPTWSRALDGTVDSLRTRYAPDGPYVHALEVPAGSLDSGVVDRREPGARPVTDAGRRGCDAGRRRQLVAVQRRRADRRARPGRWRAGRRSSARAPDPTRSW